MDSLQESDISTFVQDIQDKISIAVAIAVIRSKPANVSTQEYVSELQERALKDWQKRKTPDIFEDRLVSLRLKKVAEDVAGVLPDSPTVEEDDSPIMPSCCSSYLPEDNRPDEAVVEEHRVLFKSLVQLKFATETKKTVLFGRVREFIDEARDRRGKFCSPKRSQVSDDSGVATSAGYPGKGPDAVSSSLFKSITHSVDTEELIVKTTRCLLKYVNFAVFHSPFDHYYNWKGSLLEKVCEVLAGALTDARCRAEVTSFLDASLDQIWTTDDTFKSFAIEYQLLILSSLCQVCDVCSSLLNNVMSKCEELATNFSDAGPPSPDSVPKIEKLPLFLSLAELVLSKWQRRAREKMRSESLEQSSSNDLWKLRTNDADRSLDKTEALTSSWLDTLQRLSVSCVETDPLVHTHVHRTISMLHDQDETPELFTGGPTGFFCSEENDPPFKPI